MSDVALHKPSMTIRSRRRIPEAEAHAALTTHLANAEAAAPGLISDDGKRLTPKDGIIHSVLILMERTVLYHKCFIKFERLPTRLGSFRPWKSMSHNNPNVRPSTVFRFGRFAR